MREKIFEIRERNNWDTPIQIILKNEEELKIRLYLVLMMMWFLPTKGILLILLGLLYIPAITYRKIYNILW
ncbi:MAG: hypothetical protein ABTA16_16990 [Niallia sp.]